MEPLPETRVKLTVTPEWLVWPDSTTVPDAEKVWVVTGRWIVKTPLSPAALMVPLESIPRTRTRAWVELIVEGTAQL